MQEIQDIMEELASLGKESTRNIYINHGCTADQYGVSVADQKNILKRYKKRHDVALKLFETKNADAQYLAGLMAEPKSFSKEDLKTWVELSSWQMIHEYALAWNIAESAFGEELSLELISDESPKNRQIGWASLASYTMLEKRPELEESLYLQLIAKIEQELQGEENRVKYCMNNFLLALGGSEASFTLTCKNAAEKIGKVEVFMGKTSCRVPEVVPYLEKMEGMGRIGKRKRTVKC